MAKVYFKHVDSYSKTEVIQSVSKELLDKIVRDENIKLENFIPLKVHFGEKGNNTYIASENYLGIIDYLKEKNVHSAFIETSVLYRGERNSKEKHVKLALEHGFTQLPIIIADGEHGEDYEEVEIDKNNFKNCKVAGEIARSKQLIILSHFKGHALAGFGGAIKQLGMGCASIGGKLAQHANSKPNISYFKCKACNACVKKCPVSAITINKKAKIDKDKCIGCASCISVCPHGAISNSWVASISKSFNERLVEYAFAAAKNKNNIYITFAFNITRGCDCEGHSMQTIVKDLGIFASKDPVAIDMACLDMLDKTNGKTVFKRGRYTLQYAEKIGLGSSKYELIEI
jgi:uncharacterized Fe-S center protein